jgi:hypothetical protein
MRKTAHDEWIEAHVPARLDRLPWSRWHWLIVVALGATFVIPTRLRREESLIVSEQ